MRTFLNDDGGNSKASWVVLDFGRSVTLDGFRAYVYGDGVHDPKNMFLQAAKGKGTVTGTGGGEYTWDGGPIAWFTGRASNGTEATPEPLTEDFYFLPAKAQHWRWVVLTCWPSSKTKASHAMISEVEFHEAGSAKGVFMLNSGTRGESIVASSSGDGTPENPAWQAVDGLVRYRSYTYGYDAVINTLPDPPKPPQAPSGSNGTIWRWDGINGNNGVWIGSTKAGMRLYLKGDDPLWQAGQWALGSCARVTLVGFPSASCFCVLSDVEASALHGPLR